MEQNNKELKMFIKYYNDEKETEIAMREMFDYKYQDSKMANHQAKKQALDKTIAYIQRYYKVSPKKMRKFTVSHAISSTLLGITAGATTMAATNESLGVENGLMLSTAVGAGTIAVLEFMAYRDRKIVKKFDQKAQKAAEMERAIRDYHKHDTTVLSDGMFVAGKAPKRAR